MNLLLNTLGMRSDAAAKLASAAIRLTQTASPILIATLWQSLALTALTALCLRLVPRTSATLRFSLWTAALLLICFLPLAAPSSTTHTFLHADLRWSFALAALWLSLTLYRAFDLARHALRLHALSRQAKLVSVGPSLSTLFRKHRNAQLCTSTELDRPGVIGFFHPRILIPAWLFEQLTATELEQIVLHELEHLRRRDDWLNLLQKLALVLFPLNPALHWIERRLCLERELACDEGVVRRTKAPRLYATCLARLAEHGLDHRALSLALGFLERQSELTLRVTGILRAHRALSPRQNLALTGVVAALLLGGSVELARCPQLVSFTPVPLTLTNNGGPSLTPETWGTERDTKPFLYTDAVTHRLVHASVRQIRKPLRKIKARRTHLPGIIQHAWTEQAIPGGLLATDLTQPAAAIQVPIAPTLVRYTLVHVDGGWFLLQL